MAQPVIPIISPEAARHLIGKPGVVVADARGGADARERYVSGHIRGALFLDLERDLSDKARDPAHGGRHPLPEPRTFGRLLGAMGVSPSSHVLIYDDQYGANAAARLWWMLRAAGHTQVQVIDGGLQHLIQAGLEPARGEPPHTAPTEAYPLEEWKLPLAGIETVDKARSEKDSLVIDVREGYRYRGESEPIDPVAGHIPGAVNAPYVDNLEASKRFRSPAALASEFRRLFGDRPAGKVIVHCGSGVTACHTLLAMEFAGISGASLYAGSWSEWSRREKPLQTGPNP